MKTFKSAVVLSFLVLGSVFTYADTAVVGSHLKQEGSTLLLADDIVSFDLEGINLSFDTPGAYMHEDNNGGNGTFHNLTTTFTQWSGVTSSNATTGLIVDEGVGTITFSPGLGGRYVGVLHSSVKGPTGKTITIAVFKNDSPIDDIKHSIAKGSERLPTFRSISSDGSDATYDTYSTLSYLYYSDKEAIRFQESGTGSTGCLYVVTEYEEVDRPSLLVLNNTMYIGGVSHYVDVQAWNYNTSTWIDLRSAVSDFEDIGTEEDYKKQNTRWAFPLNREDFVSGNKVRIRMVHNNVTCNSDHIVLVDETYIIDHFSSASAAYPIEFSVEAGDVLSLRYKADEDDVTLNILDLGLNIFKIGL